jgi:hypothetical protein
LNDKGINVDHHNCSKLLYFQLGIRPLSVSQPTQQRDEHLVHLADEGVDVLLTVTSVTALDVVLELAGAEATSGVGELEGPEEVVGLLEVGADGVDLVDEILHADNAELAEVLLDYLVVGEGNTLLVDLSVTALVDELTDGLEVGVTVGDVGVDDGEHLLGGLREANEGTVVDLDQTEQLKDLARLRSNLVDTLDTDNEDKLGLVRDVEVTLLAGDAGQADLLTLSIAVLLDVGLGALEDDGALLLVGLKFELANCQKHNLMQSKL